MNRNRNSRSYLGFPIFQPVVSTVEAEKTELLVIMRDYINKQKDKEKTIASLTTLETKLNSPS